ncbi:unnamed protein product [Prunus armeniaca]|uniref:Uncharacterized protein n=1 Tax=Prunus armeniaca TaxID=36596 RepID=A0A6J5Y7R8_PRUAR|nr:unnamed protein product [Prunus armeniaca]CAB4319548.1 unnamed protein product [Prunus armeniaca]
MSAKFIAKGSTNSVAKNKTSGTLTPSGRVSYEWSGPNVRINRKINFVDNSSSSNVIKAVRTQVCSVDVKDDVNGIFAFNIGVDTAMCASTIKDLKSAYAIDILNVLEPRIRGLRG